MWNMFKVNKDTRTTLLKVNNKNTRTQSQSEIPCYPFTCIFLKQKTKKKIFKKVILFFLEKKLKNEKRGIFFKKLALQINLTLLWWSFLSNRNQSIDLLTKSMCRFLYDRDIHHETVNDFILKIEPKLAKRSLYLRGQAKPTTLLKKRPWHRCFLWVLRNF